MPTCSDLLSLQPMHAGWGPGLDPHLPSPSVGNPGGELHATGKGSLARRPVRSSPGVQKARQLAAFTLLLGTVPRVPYHRPCTSCQEWEHSLQQPPVLTCSLSPCANTLLETLLIPIFQGLLHPANRRLRVRSPKLLCEACFCGGTHTF